MRVPVSAIWPPIALLAADIAAISVVAIWSWWLAAPLVLGAIILCFDIVGRSADFRHAARHIQAGRKPERVARNYQFSWCGRVACASAAASVSKECGHRVAHYYASNGYRWFHIFPDGAFTRNSPFLSLRFWQITLGGGPRTASRLEADGDLQACDEAGEDTGLGQAA